MLPLGKLFYLATFCTVLDFEYDIGHSQKEHDTSHGSMVESKWAIDDVDGEGVEVEGRRFSTNDDGAPMLVGDVSRGNLTPSDDCDPLVLRVLSSIRPSYPC